MGRKPALLSLLDGSDLTRDVVYRVDVAQEDGNPLFAGVAHHRQGVDDQLPAVDGDQLVNMGNTALQYVLNEQNIVKLLDLTAHLFGSLIHDTAKIVYTQHIERIKIEIGARSLIIDMKHTILEQLEDGHKLFLLYLFFSCKPCEVLCPLYGVGDTVAIGENRKALSTAGLACRGDHAAPDKNTDAFLHSPQHTLTEFAKCAVRNFIQLDAAKIFQKFAVDPLLLLNGNTDLRGQLACPEQSLGPVHIRLIDIDNASADVIYNGRGK